MASQWINAYTSGSIITPLEAERGPNAGSKLRVSRKQVEKGMNGAFLFFQLLRELRDLIYHELWLHTSCIEVDPSRTALAYAYYKGATYRDV